MKRLLFTVWIALALPLWAVGLPSWSGDGLKVWSRSVVRLKARMEGDILVLTDFGKDSSIRLGGLAFDASDTNGIEFEYRAFNTPVKTTGQIFFYDAQHKVKGPFFLPSLKGDGQWHTIRVTRANLRNPGAWTGIIPTLRLDFMDQEGGPDCRIEIRRIAISPKPVADGSDLEWKSGERLREWQSVRCRIAVEDDVLKLTNIGRDCNIQRKGLSFPAKEYIGIDFEYRATGLPEKTNGQIFFAGDGGKIRGPFYLPSLKSDGQWHKLEMRSANLKDKSSWSNAGTINFLRIDPMDQEGGPDGKIEIRNIKVVPVPAGNSENFGGHTFLRLPPAAKKPVIDGTFSTSEWSGMTAQHGGVSNINGMLAFRWVDFFFGYDDDFVYFAHRSILPPAPMVIDDEDTVELDIGLGNGPLRRIVVNHKGEGDLPAGTRLKSWLDKSNFWITEMAVPVTSLGVTAIPYGKECRLQMVRHYRNITEDISWHSPTPRNPFAVLVPEKGIPLVSFPSLFPVLGAPSSSHAPSWNVQNTSGIPQNVSFDISITSHEQPIVISRTDTIAPGKSTSAMVRGQWMWDVIRHMRMEIRDASTGNPYLQRYFSWDRAKMFRWQNPNPPYQLKIAVYPTARRVRAMVTCEKQEKIKGINPPEIAIVNAGGKTVASLAVVRKKTGFLHDGSLPELPEGTYSIRAVLKNTKGETETLSDHFDVRHFPWQNLGLGKERIIIPPFKPLVADESMVRALQTGFREADNGWWDALFAQDENILAKPVEFTLNGEMPQLTGRRTLEVSPDLVVREVDLKFKDILLTIRKEYEQDGFCKVTMNFKPVRPVNIRQMDICVPLKKSLAQYYFASGINIRMNIKGRIPASRGVVMDSSKQGNAVGNYLGGFRPYIWLGGYAKGLCFVCETPRGWGRNQNRPFQEITVDEDAVRLRLHIAAAPVTYSAPQTIVMGFQPTPVKPRPAGSQAYMSPPPPGPALPAEARGFVLFPHNSVFFRYEDGMYVPPNNDWSFIEYILAGKWKDTAEVDAFTAEYFKRNGLSPNRFSMLRGPNSWWAKCPMTRYLRETALRAKPSDYIVIYSNSRILSHTWPEFEVYADEWDLRAWRPPRELNEFSTEPVPSFVDFSLYRIRDMLRHGMSGAYYDNVYEGVCWDPVTSAAFEEEDGSIRPAYGIFALRDLVKRTAVMMVQEGKSFLGAPPIMLHMTDCPLVPVLSFAGLQLDWEMQFGRNTYQTRFPLEYGVCATTGAQAGVCPTVLLNTAGCDGDKARVVRSALAMAFIYNVTGHMLTTDGKPLDGCEFYFNAMKHIHAFGYGRPDTITWPALMPENPVKISPENIKATVSRRSDGALLLMIGNLGREAVAKIDLGTLGSGQATDLMTGKTLGAGRIISVPVQAEGFALLSITPHP